MRLLYLEAKRLRRKEGSAVGDPTTRRPKGCRAEAARRLEWEGLRKSKGLTWRMNPGALPICQ